jgi:CRP/FNR family transcriptional regulator, cyclic AMP receptor protein
MILTQILKHIDLCRGLTEEQLQRLADISEKETFDEDAVIFNQGAIGDKMYIIAEGQVEIRVRDGQGGAHTALYLGEGQIFGEMALLDTGTRSATVVAVQESTTVYSIPGDAFTNLCRADTAIGYVIMRNMAQDLSFKLRHRDFDTANND